jgi:hypothetical protein
VQDCTQKGSVVCNQQEKSTLQATSGIKIVINNNK